MGKFCDKEGHWQNHTADVVYQGGFRDGAYCGKGKIAVKGMHAVMESVFFNGISLWDRKIMIRRDSQIDRDCCLSLANDDEGETYSKHSVWIVDNGNSFRVGRNDKYRVINMVTKFGYLSRGIVLN